MTSPPAGLAEARKQILRYIEPELLLMCAAYGIDPAQLDTDGHGPAIAARAALALADLGVVDQAAWSAARTPTPVLAGMDRALTDAQVISMLAGAAHEEASTKARADNLRELVAQVRAWEAETIARHRALRDEAKRRGLDIPLRNPEETS
ncbi:hypothetical protein [Agromyces humi]|uniref:hypothetical protein n=1 Tax=Agromyces humi TaxID=1766800 RepID=UPI0013573CD1|nr:hypothetical protein [Agromyces humi]